MRLLRPGAPDPRLPGVLRPHARGVRRAPHGLCRSRRAVAGRRRQVNFVQYGLASHCYAFSSDRRRNAMTTAPTTYPCLSYRDAPAAMEWLKWAFGMKEMLVVPDENGGIAHAEMSIGDGVIMIGS